ncbi:LysE family transporter [Pasteurellaceae bacterium 20609_3]|uniref:LysE/ArgO family amino acid transporter n=1 Tax=Spirabiliibacterium mucosae TaxID=28156 RepID=UPI001AAD45A8|nr:LysE family transporter [Spirabiliibacterium mucosae]MBE2898920.1 LysE family transporter [Spirabiliibacterium mucosae]
MENFIYGLLLSGSMIMAIGAQNVFVIKNGIVRNNAMVIAFVCFLCDVLLMFVGVFFVGAVATINPWVTLVISCLAVAFLCWCGWQAWKTARKGDYQHDFSLKQQRSSVGSSIAAALAITMLNPHVYLDTVVVVGGVAAQLDQLGKWQFITGAWMASAVWFFSIAYFSRFALKLFQNRKAWVIFDTGVALFMWFLAANVAWYAVNSIFIKI